MAMQRETYKGFVIEASAKPVDEGYLPGATVRRIADFTHREFDVRPPALACGTAKAALNEALLWGRDLVDGLSDDFTSGKLH